MNYGAVPPTAIGLAAGLLTTAAAVALSATGLLPAWVTTPLLLLAGGLAAGLAAPVRPTIGALLGAATGVFAGFLEAVVAVLLWTPVPNQYITPPPLLLIALLGVIFSVPVYAVAGAVGAAVRPLLMPRSSSVERVRGLTPERRQLAGIAAGALIIAVSFGLWVVASRAGLYFDGNALTVLFLVSGLAGGFAAGVLSSGGARAGVGSGLLAGVFGLGAVALYFILQASTRPATGDGVPEGLWPIALAIMAFWVLPAVALGGALGGSFGKSSGPSQASPEREL
ncbi:MAG: hypothetical protein ABFC38_14935 [Methanospirillum sp.]